MARSFPRQPKPPKPVKPANVLPYEPTELSEDGTNNDLISGTVPELFQKLPIQLRTKQKQAISAYIQAIILNGTTENRFYRYRMPMDGTFTSMTLYVGRMDVVHEGRYANLAVFLNGTQVWAGPIGIGANIIQAKEGKVSAGDVIELAVQTNIATSFTCSFVDIIATYEV